MRVVYHGSSRSGLRVIVPARSTHGQPLVHACKDPVMTALFLSGTGGGLTCAVGREQATSHPYLCERFAGALEHRYASRGGSIYTLPGNTFVEGRTPWDEEVVSPLEVRPVAESAVDDTYCHLQRLAEQGLLHIYRYPSRPPDVPVDDEDLVMRGIAWTRELGDAVLESFAAYHPHLMERITRGLAEGRYPNGLPRH